MKKFLFSVAILAAAASCSKNEVVEIPSTAEIGFATLNNRVTKAANDDADNYKVYAYVKADASASYSTTAYIDEEVVGGTDAFVTTANHYYWPTAAGSAVNFYAAAPVTKVTAGNANEHLFSYIVSSPANVDFTVAATVQGATCTPTTPVPTPATAAFTPATGESYVDSNGKVQLKFYHMLSKADFNVKLADELKNKYTFTFSNAILEVDKNKVKVKEYSSNIPTSETEDGASISGDCIYYYNKFNDNAATPAAATMGTTYDTSFTGTQNLFFAPQDGSGCSIKLTGVKIKDVTGLEIFDGNLTYTLESTDVFAAGSAYDFNITIETSKTNLFEILFASDLADWTTTTPGVDIN